MDPMREARVSVNMAERRRNSDVGSILMGLQLWTSQTRIPGKVVFVS